MSRHRTTLILACAGLLVLSGAVTALREPILESWAIHRLDSENPETRAAAARALGERRSLRALPKLLDLSRGASFVIFG